MATEEQVLTDEQVAQATVAPPELTDKQVINVSSKNKPTIEKRSVLDEMLAPKGSERAISFAVGGPTTAVGPSRQAEEALPVVMGGIGSAVGGIAGKPNVGFGVGTALGELERQAINKLKGEGENIDVNDALALGGLAIVGGKVFDFALKSAGVSMKLVPEKARAKLFDKALQAVNVGRKQLGRNWRRAVTELTERFPNRKINMRPAIKQLKEQAEGIDDTLIPQLKTAVRRNKRLREAVEDPNKAIGLTLKEAQEFKNAITSTTNTIIKKSVKGKTTPNERVVFDILDNIDDSITSQFPQMAQVRRAYKKGLDSFELARPLVERGTAVESSVFSRPQGLFGLGGTPFFKSTQGRLAVKDIMSKTESGAKLFDTLKIAHNVNRASDAVGRLVEIGLGSAALSKITGRGVND